MTSRQVGSWTRDTTRHAPLHARLRTITWYIIASLHRIRMREYKQRNTAAVMKISYGECLRKLLGVCRLLPAERFVVVLVLGVTRRRLALLLCVSSRGQGSTDSRGCTSVQVFAPRPRGVQRTRAFRWWSYRGRTVGLGNRECQRLLSE